MLRLDPCRLILGRPSLFLGALAWLFGPLQRTGPRARSKRPVFSISTIAHGSHNNLRLRGNMTRIVLASIYQT